MRIRSLLCSGLLAVLSACDLRPPHVVLTVEDPDGVAAAATALAVGFAADSLTVAERRDKPFPLTVAVVAPGPGTRSLLVEARDAAGTALARGQVQVEFPKEGTGSATVALGRACSDSAACDDQVFCNGAETCSEVGACVRGQAPCSSPPYPCVDLACVEAAKACSTRVDHSRCTPATLPDGTLQARYCDPSSGCVPGKACTTAEECQDASVCNGEERCTYFHCVAGEPVLLDDLDPCTLDYCLDPAGPQHLANPELEGAACTLADDSRLHLCRRGVCVASLCGDGLVDPRSEACDDSNADPNDGCDACRQTRWTSTVVTGLGRHQGQPRQLSLKLPEKLAVSRAGTVYVTDDFAERVWRIEPDRATVAAGLGFAGFSGDQGPAAAAQLSTPTSVALDGEENLYIADLYNDRIRRVDGRTGQISTFAGGGTSPAEGVPAIAAKVGRPGEVAVDGVGNVYFLDLVRRLVRRVDADTGLVFTVAGSESAAGTDDGPALATRLDGPSCLVLASPDTLYVAEQTRVRRLTLARPRDPTSGTLSTVAGDGSTSYGDGVPALAAGVSSILAMAVDASGDLFLADEELNAIRRIHWNPDDPAASLIETVVGNGDWGRPVDGPALASPVGLAKGLAFTPDGALLYSDELTLGVRKVSRPSASPATWTTALLAGGPSDLDAVEASPPTTVRIWSHALAVWGERIYLADRDRDVVWSLTRVDPADPMTWKLSRVAGGGTSQANGAPAREAALSLSGQGSLGVGADGALYISCTGDHRVRRLMLDPAHPRHGLLDLVAGDGSTSTHGDGGPAVQAGLPDLFQLALDPAQRLFLTTDDRIRYVQTDPARPLDEWTIGAAAGTGVRGSSGDGGLARRATFQELYGLAASDRHVFVTSKVSPNLRAFSTSGPAADWTIFRAAGTGATGFTASGPASTAALNEPYGLAMDHARQTLYLADRRNNVVQRLAVGAADPAEWTLDTLNLQGSTLDNFHGEGLPLGQVMLYAPRGVAVGAQDLYVNLYDAVRRVSLADRADPTSWTVTTVMGGIDPEGDGPLALGGLGAPQALAPLDERHFAITDGPNGRVRWVDLDQQQVRTLAGQPGRTSPGPEARTSRLLRGASGIAWDPPSQSFFVAEASGHLIRRLRVTDLSKPWTWTIEDFAGALGDSGHRDGPLATARFDGPAGLALDVTGRRLYVADSRNHVLRAIRVDQPEAADCVTTVAGMPGHRGYFEGPAADEALFQGPTALALDGSGGLYVADTGNHRVRRLDLLARTVTTVLGTGVGGSTGTGAPARLFPVDAPRGLAVDGAGNLFVSSRDSVRLVTRGTGAVVDGSGTVLTVLDAATSRARCLTGLQLLEKDRQLLVLDECQGLLLRLERTAQ